MADKRTHNGAAEAGLADVDTKPNYLSPLGASQPDIFVFNVYGYIYQEGIDRLSSGFRLASDRMQHEIEVLKQSLLAYQAHVESGGERIGEWEDGYALWEQDQIFEMDIESAEASIADLRKAYALALYHCWERSARRWTGSGANACHEDLVRKTQEAGYPIDARLIGLKNLADTLKHNKEARARDLEKNWPSVVGPYPVGGTIDWYDVVKLEDADMRTACDILRGSGPTVNSP